MPVGGWSVGVQRGTRSANSARTAAITSASASQAAAGRRVPATPTGSMASHRRVASATTAPDVAEGIAARVVRTVVNTPGRGEDV